MNWKKWLGFSIYKKLWSLVGKRPWTYILRDTWHKAEFVWIIGLVAVGVALGHLFDWIIILEMMAIFTVGFIAGHLFWGKKYIPNQQPEITPFPDED